MFELLWNSHWKWTSGIFSKEIKKYDTFTFYRGTYADKYYNFVVPLVNSPSQLNIDEINSLMKTSDLTPTVYLFENHIRSGFVEFLIRNGYIFDSEDTWVSLNLNAYQKRDVLVDIRKIDQSNFSEYKAVDSKVFFDYVANEEYLEICRKCLNGELSSNLVSDLNAELYSIYVDNQAVATGGIFFSKFENIAYLHDDGTLPDFGGKGYQTALIGHRLNIAADQGITRIYALVEHGSKSWRNYLKLGFDQIQIANVFSYKNI